MKDKEKILEELKASGWEEAQADSFIINNLIPQLDKVINDDETIETSISGIQLTNDGKETSIEEMIIATNKRIVAVYGDKKDETTAPKVETKDLKDVHKVIIQDSTNQDNKKRVDVILILSNSTWTIDTEDNSSVKQFEQKLNKVFGDVKVDDETFDIKYNQNKTETTLDKTSSPSTNKKEKSKKFTNSWFVTNFKNNKLSSNQVFWNLISLIMALAIMITAAVFIGVADKGAMKKGVYIPDGIMQLLFALIGMVAIGMTAHNNWKVSRFSFDLYRNLLGLLGYFLIFVFGIIMAANSIASVALQSITIVMSILIIFDNGYQFTKLRLSK